MPATFWSKPLDFEPGAERGLRKHVDPLLGGTNGFSSMIVRVPEERILIVALDNVLGSEWGPMTRGIAQVSKRRSPAIAFLFKRSDYRVVQAHAPLKGGA